MEAIMSRLYIVSGVGAGMVVGAALVGGAWYTDILGFQRTKQAVAYTQGLLQDKVTPDFKIGQVLIDNDKDAKYRAKVTENIRKENASQRPLQCYTILVTGRGMPMIIDHDPLVCS